MPPLTHTWLAIVGFFRIPQPQNRIIQVRFDDARFDSPASVPKYTESKKSSLGARRLTYVASMTYRETIGFELRSNPGWPTPDIVS